MTGRSFLQLLFGPREAVDSPVHISAIGRGLFRAYRFQEGALKLLPCSLMKKPQPAFTAHAWITEGQCPCSHHDVLLGLLGEMQTQFPAHVECGCSNFRQFLHIWSEPCYCRHYTSSLWELGIMAAITGATVASLLDMYSV